MSITLTSQNKEAYLLIESKGTIETGEELIAQSQMLYAEISRNGATKILIDNRETHLPLELVPYFDLIKEYIHNFPPEIFSLNIAVVTNDEYKEVAGSWGVLCQSRGLKYFTFTSMDDAINCLAN